MSYAECHPPMPWFSVMFFGPLIATGLLHYATFAAPPPLKK